MILLGKAKPKVRNPIEEVHSNYKASKSWLGDMVLCACTFPHQPMRKGFFGWHCNNSSCRDFISNTDAKHIERVRLDTASVNRFLTSNHSSNVMRRYAKAERTGDYFQAFPK